MSFAQTLAKRIKENIEVTIELKNSRIAICDQCPELRESIRQCKKCGCLVDAKALLKNQHCPLEKW
jgi:hypothetical protein